MIKKDKQEDIIDALMNALTAFKEAGCEGTAEYKIIQKIADDAFNDWVTNYTKH